MKLVVGLGNPGREYQGTRHNIGFDVVEELAKRFQADRWQARFEAKITEITIQSERLLLAEPQTYMNLSGRSVRTIVGFYKLDLSDILLVCDDLNLPLGQLRLKCTGSAGGQKGLKNTIEQLKTEDFARLRVGIDRPAPGFDVANYVLAPFPVADRDVVESTVQRAASAVEVWALEGANAAMNQYN